MKMPAGPFPHWTYGMNKRLDLLLAAIGGFLAVLDAVWLACGHFDIDARAYLFLVLIVPIMMGASVYYGQVRDEPAISAMFSATGFLVVFPAACCLLSYLVLAIAGPRIDNQLAALDRQLGFSWPALMAYAADHPGLTAALLWIYNSIVPQTLFLVLLLGWKKLPADLYGLCISMGVGAILTLALWTAYPSFGAFSVYHLPHVVAAKLHLVEDGSYARQLASMLHNGPGFITPAELRGIVGFPSYHTVQAMVLAWYARHIPYGRWGAVVLNVLVICSAPIHGGHHIVDLFGGAIVGTIAIIAADMIVRRLARPGRNVLQAAAASSPAAA